MAHRECVFKQFFFEVALVPAVLWAAGFAAGPALLVADEVSREVCACEQRLRGELETFRVWAGCPATDSETGEWFPETGWRLRDVSPRHSASR